MLLPGSLLRFGAHASKQCVLSLLEYGGVSNCCRYRVIDAPPAEPAETVESFLQDLDGQPEGMHSATHTMADPPV